MIELTKEEYTQLVAQNALTTMLVNTLLNGLSKEYGPLRIANEDIVLSMLQMIAPEPFQAKIESLTKAEALTKADSLKEAKDED